MISLWDAPGQWVDRDVKASQGQLVIAGRRGQRGPWAVLVNQGHLADLDLRAGQAPEVRLDLKVVLASRGNRAEPDARATRVRQAVQGATAAMASG